MATYALLIQLNSNWVGDWWAATPADVVVEVTSDEPGVAYIGERMTGRSLRSMTTKAHLERVLRAMVD